MERPSERRGRLERSAGRGVRLATGSRPARPLVAGALVAALGVAVLALPRGSHAAPPRPVTTPGSSAPSSRAPTVPRDRLVGCVVVHAAASELRCVLDGVELDVRAVGARVASEYRRVAGAVQPGSGPPSCARGRADERSWSRAARPARPAGRYRCRIEAGRAAMWWTDLDAGLLVHAVAPGRDLAALFRWWRAHPGV